VLKELRKICHWIRFQFTSLPHLCLENLDHLNFRCLWLQNYLLLLDVILRQIIRLGLLQGCFCHPVHKCAPILARLGRYLLNSSDVNWMRTNIADDVATSGECKRLFSGVTSAKRPINTANAMLSTCHADILQILSKIWTEKKRSASDIYPRSTKSRQLFGVRMNTRRSSEIFLQVPEAHARWQSALRT